MKKKTKPTAFLSYSSKDKELARRVQAYLTASGAVIWFDEYEIKAGESITSKVQAGLAKSQYVLLLLTGNSIRSGWVEREWKIKFWEEAKKGQVSIIPILAADCVIPLLLKDKRYADIRGEQFITGMNEVKIALGLTQLKSATQEIDLITSEALNLLDGQILFEEISDPDWPARRRLAAISAALYSKPVSILNVKQDYVDYAGFCNEISSLAVSSFGKIVISGNAGCGKTSLLNAIAAKLNDIGAQVLVLDPHDDLEEGDCYYLSYQILAKLCRNNFLGPATAHIEQILSKGLQEGGLWWSSLKKATRFLDAVMEKLRKQTVEIPVVILLHDLDSDYHNWSQSEVCSEFLHFTSGSYVVTSYMGAEDWLSRYVEHQVEIPAVTPGQLQRIIDARLNSLPFDCRDLVILDTALCNFLIKTCGQDLRSMFALCRESLRINQMLSVKTLKSIKTSNKKLTPLD